MTNKQRILAMFQEIAALKDKDGVEKKQGMEKILSMMSEDVVWTTQGPADIIPYAGVHQGRMGVAKMFETQDQVLQPAEFLAAPQIIGADDGAVQVFYMPNEKVKLKAAPHKDYETGFAMFLTFNDAGLISAVTSIFDTYAVAKAFEA